MRNDKVYMLSFHPPFSPLLIPFFFSLYVYVFMLEAGRNEY